MDLRKNKHESKERNDGRGVKGKVAVLGMRERDGKTKVKVVEKTDGETLGGEISRSVEKGSVSSASYAGLLKLDGVYPTQDSEIAIDVFNGRGSSIILLCDLSGETLCLVNIEGSRRRAHYSKVNALSDGFVREALAELDL